MALEAESSNLSTHPTFFNIGVSPSGKARDFDSRIRRFKSCHPSQKRLIFCLPKDESFQLNPPCRVGEIRSSGEIVLADGEIRLDAGWVDLISPKSQTSISPEGISPRISPRQRRDFTIESFTFFEYNVKEKRSTNRDLTSRRQQQVACQRQSNMI